MRLIEIDPTPNQRFLVPFEGLNIEVKFVFKDSGFWVADFIYQDKSIYGITLSSRVLLLQGLNLPFDFVIDDKNANLDPYSLNSFDEQFSLYLLEREDMINIRGYDVK